MNRALISVSDKNGLVEFANGLTQLAWELVSTGGTAKLLDTHDIPRTLVEKVTGFPEMLNGRVKTLHPNIFAGIIADMHDPSHAEQLVAKGIKAFQMVVCNLYPFAAQPCIEQIDVGGPSMIRAAAKNYRSIIIITDPDDYGWILERLHAGEEINPNERLSLARKAFDLTADYDRKIEEVFRKCVLGNRHPEQGPKH